MYSRCFRDWILSLKLMSHVKRTWQAYSSVITVSIKIPTWFRKISPLIGINKTIWSRFHDCNALIGSLRLICKINTRSSNRHAGKYEWMMKKLSRRFGAFKLSFLSSCSRPEIPLYSNRPRQIYHHKMTWHLWQNHHRQTTGFHNETAVFKSIQTSKCFVNVQSLHLSLSLRSRVKLMNIKQKTLFLFLLQLNI